MKRSQAIAGVVLLTVLAGVLFAVGGAAAQTDEVTLTIKPVDSDGNALGDVDFTATWDGEEISATTLSKGTYPFDVPAGASVKIEIADDEYIRNSPYVIGDAETEVVEIPVAESGQATVTVEAGGQPLADAEVELVRDGTVVSQGVSGQDGTFRTGRVEQGEYTVRAVKPTYYENTTSIDIGTFTQQTVQLRGGTVEVNFRVTDDYFETPQPVGDAVIEFVDRETRLGTHGDGTRSTTLSVNQEVEVEVTKEGYQTTTETVVIGERALTKNVSIRRTPVLNLDVLSDRVVVGENTRISVTNEYNEPVANADVVVGGDRVGATDDSGEATVPVQTTGDVTIEVTKAGLSTSQTVEGVEVGGEETPTTTATGETTETETETETDTETASETASQTGPGFGVVVTVLAVLGVALLVRRR